MNRLILGLGGNKGEVLLTLKKAEQLIIDEIGSVIKKSSNYKTAAWGNTNQPDFINSVVVVNTDLEIEQCLLKVLHIEQQLGRIRSDKKWEERIIDIDILFFNDVIIEREHLLVPHPYIQDRKFVLIPLVEILPNEYHPKLNKNFKTLLENCIDMLDVQKVIPQ